MKTKITLFSVAHVLIAIQFLLNSTGINARTVDANAPPEPKDRKTALVDNSKGKEAPLLQKNWCETPSPWEVRAGLPAWLAGLSGESGVKGVDASSDVRFEQLLKHLTHFPIALSADVRYQRWEFFGDGQYIEVGTSATLPGLLFTHANIHIKSGLAEGFVGYRLINCAKVSLSFFTGARYSYMSGNLSIFDNGDARLPLLRELVGLPKKLDAKGSIDWVDPVIGLRGKAKIWKATSLYAEGDIGGFDANSGSAFEVRPQGSTLAKTSVSSSDWSYQAQGGLEFQLTRSIWTQLGWRYLKYDYRISGFTDKLALNGPFLQTGVNF
jgi:opacity protein-like surface antigen